MSKTLKTTFRAHETIEKAASDCRDLAMLASTMSFSVTEFISGPLKQHFRGRLSIQIQGFDILDGPAEVVIASDRSQICLRVEKNIWESAEKGDAEAKRILAHEIGHIWLHRDERFKFSEIDDGEHAFIPNEN